jgi:MarR family transcriptional regulator, organic hydroperoxide resistance regulator
MQTRRNVLNLMSKIRARAFLFLERELVQAGAHELSPAHGDVLFAVSQNSGVDMRQLAVLTGRDKSTLTPLVDRLIRSGYLNRKVSVSDRRRAEIYLTPKAEKIRPRLLKIGFKLEKIMHRDIAESDLEILTATLNRIHTNLGDAPQKN